METQSGLLEGIISIAAGFYDHKLAVCERGYGWAWGYDNSYGKFGVGDTNSRPEPAQMLCAEVPGCIYLAKTLEVEGNEPNCVIPDDYITYTISYANPITDPCDPNYTGDVNNVVITDYLPDELVFISASGPNSVYNPSAHTVTWQIGPLDAGASNDSVTLTMKVNGCAESDGNIINYCVIESDIAYRDAECVTYLCSASNPNPTCGAIVDLDTGELNLTWCPGHFAADSNGHEVYFGSNFNDVHDANNLWPIGGVYKGPVTDPCYTIEFNDLDMDTTYYWRVDEVNTNHPDKRWKGGVWSFKTWNYFVVENFDSYADSDALKVVWKEGSPIAEVSLNTDSNYVRDGNSMQYHYDNYYSFYSEAYANTAALPSHIGSDWTANGVESLSLWFYGQAGNDANEQMYVKLTDGGSPAKTAKVIYHGDMNDIKKEQWREWNIALQDFVDDNDVNLANVARITIRFGDGNDPSPAPNPAGTVYFDDIRLYLERCIPGYYPVGDFDSDCDVDFYDFAIFAQAWLTSSGQQNYKPVYDISVPSDGNINGYDLARFCDNWLWQEGGATSMGSGFSEALYAAAPPEQPQIELQPEPEPQPQVQSEPELLQPEPELQPQSQPEPELQPEPQPQPEPPQPEPQPEQQQSMLAGPNETPGIWLVYDGNMTPSSGDEITVYIHSDPMLLCMGTVVEVVGDANITTAMSEADCNSFGWDNGWNSDPYIDPSGWLCINGVSWDCIVNGTVGYFKFRYNSGEVTVSIMAESCAYDAYCQPVLFSPQPLIFSRDPNEQ